MAKPFAVIATLLAGNAPRVAALEWRMQETSQLARLAEHNCAK